MLNAHYPHHPPLHSTNCSVRNQGSVASAGITSPCFPLPFPFCPFSLHSTNVVTIFISTIAQTGESPWMVSNCPGSVSLWTLSLPPTPPLIPHQDVYRAESCTPTETQLSPVTAGTIKVVLRWWTRQAIIILHQPQVFIRLVEVLHERDISTVLGPSLIYDSSVPSVSLVYRTASETARWPSVLVPSPPLY